jgi:hypothetical protein
MKIVNQDLWLGMSSASNGAKPFARITLDFTIISVCLSVEEVTVRAGFKIFVEVDVESKLIVHNPQGIFVHHLRPRPIHCLIIINDI